MLCADGKTDKVPSGTYKDYVVTPAVKTTPAPSTKPKTPVTKVVTPAAVKLPKAGTSAITVGTLTKAEAALAAANLKLVDIPNTGLQNQLDSYQATVQRFAGKTFTTFKA